MLSGWERFFTELSIFLNTADRHTDSANEAYSEHVLECLQISLISVGSLMEHLHTVTPRNEDQASASAHYYSEIAEFVQCVREVVSHHLYERMSRDVATSYSAPTENVAHGRPRFNIPREEIIHLASMSFTWTQIAAILEEYCVSQTLRVQTARPWEREH